jgi:hypothetical protein
MVDSSYLSYMLDGPDAGHLIFGLFVRKLATT